MWRLTLILLIFCKIPEVIGIWQAVQDSNLNTYCSDKYTFLFGMTSCYLKGWKYSQQFQNGVLPSVDSCVARSSIASCKEGMVCNALLGWARAADSSSTGLSNPDRCALSLIGWVSCLSDCSSPMCSIIGYYLIPGQEWCTQMSGDPSLMCLGTSLCSSSQLFIMCQGYGYKPDTDQKTCIPILGQDCLLQNSKYCDSETSVCVQKYGFRYNPLTGVCDIDCLSDLHCAHSDDFCLKEFGYSKKLSSNSCEITITLNQCLAAVNCKMACQKQFGLIKSSTCILPSHSACELATERSILGCSQEKEVCSMMGWSQASIGSNLCKDPLGYCFGSTDCSQVDGNNVKLGEFVGLAQKTSGSLLIWMQAEFSDCINSERCRKSSYSCQKLGFKNRIQLGLPSTIIGSENLCFAPTFDACSISNDCSSSTMACCQNFGWVGSAGGRCTVPLNCKQLSKGTKTRHACESIGYIQLAVNNSKFIHIDELDLDFDYMTIFKLCEADWNLSNSQTSFLCQPSIKACTSIGFQYVNQRCSLPTPEDCLTTGQQNCGNYKICSRLMGFISSANECVLPSYASCQEQISVTSYPYDVCFSYFGFNPLQPYQYCTESGESRCESQNGLCIKYFGFSPTSASSFICVENPIVLSESQYSIYGHIFYKSLLQQTNPMPLNIISYCTNASPNSCDASCKSLGFQQVSPSNPNNCRDTIASDCLDLGIYNHSCLLYRIINPVDVKSYCESTTTPRCSSTSVCVLFYGYKVGISDTFCNAPTQSDCSAITHITDLFYHACRLSAPANDITLKCLQKGNNMCISSNKCSYQYGFLTDNVNDCLMPPYSICIPHLNENLSLACDLVFGFLASNLNGVFRAPTNNDLSQLQCFIQKSLCKEIGYVYKGGSYYPPQFLECINQDLQLCQTSTRIPNFSNYCVGIFKFTSNQINPTDKTCFVPPQECMDPVITPNCELSISCRTSGFVASKEAVGGPVCLVLDQPYVYCNSKNKDKLLYDCGAKGYRWTDNNGWIPPTHQECESNTSNLCADGQTACVSLGWTPIKGQCIFTINCTDTTMNYCYSPNSICRYVGYILTPPTDHTQIPLTCSLSSTRNCLDKGLQLCASKIYSICVQQGFSQDIDFDCKCEGVVFQSKCIQIPLASSDTTPESSNVPLLPQLLVIQLILFTFYL